MYKYLALSAMTEQKYKKEMEHPQLKSLLDKEYMFSNHTFERRYLRQLERDALREARPINEADYKPKKFVYATGEEPPTFLN